MKGLEVLVRLILTSTVDGGPVSIPMKGLEVLVRDDSHWDGDSVVFQSL